MYCEPRASRAEAKPGLWSDLHRTLDSGGPMFRASVPETSRLRVWTADAIQGTTQRLSRWFLAVGGVGGGISYRDRHWDLSRLSTSEMADHDPEANHFDPVWDRCSPPHPPWASLIPRKPLTSRYTIVWYGNIPLPSTRNYFFGLSEIPSSLR